MNTVLLRCCKDFEYDEMLSYVDFCLASWYGRIWRLGCNIRKWKISWLIKKEKAIQTQRKFTSQIRILGVLFLWTMISGYLKLNLRNSLQAVMSHVSLFCIIDALYLSLVLVTEQCSFAY
ncbi:hypothetical protein DICVIV_11970 [Dictyocaulus viviparus]|uniref:Uncharacterized protein n=1 Tax=Dictyocaulus viviparus TaxID=29172 RepID=A0A0D8XE61_DICVI|nr:hypothetical protein DICVIV_11970 [Dictyocaulus viviparus]